MGCTVCSHPSHSSICVLTYINSVDEAAIEKVLKFGPFVDWMAAINRIENPDISKPELIVDKVHVQHIDMFGPRIGFMKFEVLAQPTLPPVSYLTSNRLQQGNGTRRCNRRHLYLVSLPFPMLLFLVNDKSGIVFMRGGAVAILCILIEAETGKEYSLITLQPRIPAGYSDFAEIPAGMVC